MTLFLALLLLPGQDARLQVPERTDEHQLVVVQLLDSGATSAILRVRHRSTFEARPIFEGKSPFSWAFTGPPGEYSVEVTASTDGQLRAFDTTVTIGPRAPPPPPEPTPDEVPADEFQNVGRLAFQAAANLPAQTDAAQAYRQAAAGLRNGTYAQINDATRSIKLPEGWSDFSQTIAAHLAGQWDPQQFSKERVAAYLDAVAVGIEAHNGG